MEPYALAAVLGTWLASLVAAFLAGRATIADDERRERERAERAEERAAVLKADLVASAQRSARTAAALQGLLDRKAARDDVVNGSVGVAPADLARALDELLRTGAVGEGREAKADEAGAASAEGLEGGAQGVGSGSGSG